MLPAKEPPPRSWSEALQPRHGKGAWVVHHGYKGQGQHQAALGTSCPSAGPMMGPRPPRPIYSTLPQRGQKVPRNLKVAGQASCPPACATRQGSGWKRLSLRHTWPSSALPMLPFRASNQGSGSQKKGLLSQQRTLDGAWMGQRLPKPGIGPRLCHRRACCPVP